MKMSTRLVIAAIALAMMSLPSVSTGQQTERERERAAAEREREAERRAREREREAERREREREREEELREREEERRERERERDQEARMDTTFAFTRGGIVDLSLISGDIIVRAWSQNQVQIRAFLERGRISSDITSSRVTLNARSTSGRVGEGRFELQVPVGTRVVARGTSADIVIDGVQATVEARSTSGDIRVTGASDRVAVESVSGDVYASEVTGSVSAGVVSGDVEIVGAKGDISVTSVSGDISLARIDSRDVRTESVSGEVEFDGTIDRAGRYEFHSHSGNIFMRIPEGTGLALSLETFSGHIETDFPITLQPNAFNAGRRGGTRRLETTIAGGGARIIAETFSGTITIEKAR
jgi:DUF4097 and DUF4098 domain-containing protein YvlB